MYDTADDIMTRENDETRRTLQNIIRRAEAEIEALRRQANPAREDVTGLAGRLGRKLVKGRGPEPAFTNEWFPDLRTLMIPNKSPLKKGTAHKILNQLEMDLAALERRLNELGGPIDDD